MSTPYSNQTTMSSEGPTCRGTEERNGASVGCCPACGRCSGKKWLQAPDRFHGRPRLYTLLRCSSCSMVWLHDPPPPSEMGQHYGEDYDRAISRTGQDPRHWTRRRGTLLRYLSSGAILDLGCGSGGFLASLKGPEWKLFGIEISERAAREAEARTGAQVFVGDILDAPFPPESFDAITCFHVFEHLYQPKELLAKVREWVRPGGIFYTQMPNIDSVGAHIFRSYWYALELPRHLFHFSPATLRTLAFSSGLQEVFIATHQNLFIEASVRYVVDDIFRKVGIRRTPTAQAKRAGLPWRVVRKGFRMGVLPALNWLASFAGDREIIHAMFRKG